MAIAINHPREGFSMNSIRGQTEYRNGDECNVDFYYRRRPPDPPDAGPPDEVPLCVSASSERADDWIPEFVRRNAFYRVRSYKAKHEGMPNEERIHSWYAKDCKGVSGVSFDDYRLLILDGYDRCKSPVGMGLLAAYREEALRRPLPPAALRYKGELHQRLVAFCAVRQEHAGDQPFPLAGRPLAEELGYGRSPSRVYAALRLLCRDGVLVVTREWERGHAREYLFVGDTGKGSTQ